MKVALALLLVASFPAAAFAADAPDSRPSEASIRQLFEVMHTSSMLETIMKQIDNSARAAVSQATAGQPLNAEQQKILADMQSKLMALLKEQLDWSGLEPTMIEVYRDSFSQSEVDGMLKFYRTEAGRAVIAKLPVVMQQMVQKMQARMQTVTPKVVQLERDTAAQLQAAAAASAPQ